VADLLGLDYDHNLLEGIANSQLEASETMWRTAEQELISAKKMRDDAKSVYEEMLASGDTEGAEFYKKSMLDPAEDYYEETLSKAQDATTKYLQSI